MRLVLVAAISGLIAAAAVSALFLAAGAFEDEDEGDTVTPTPRPAAPPADPVAALFRRAQGGIVLVEARPPGTPPSFGRPSREDGIATGTGFVVDDEGLIVTNDHVAAGGRHVTIQTGPRAERVRARIVGRDSSTDLALLRVDPERAPGLAALPLGDSDEVSVGDTAIALGNPFGLQRTLTAGVVSATDRTIDAPDGYPIEGAVQTDAAINPGSSGGPLLDSDGRVIGVNVQAEPGADGIAYAIPVDTVKRVIPELRRNGRVERSYLGVGTATLGPDLARSLDLPVSRGLAVTEVTPGSPADEAGVQGPDSFDRGRPVGGDVLLAIGGRRLAEGRDLTAALERLDPGTEVRLVLLRDGRRIARQVELERRR